MSRLNVKIHICNVYIVYIVLFLRFYQIQALQGVQVLTSVSDGQLRYLILNAFKSRVPTVHQTSYILNIYNTNQHRTFELYTVVLINCLISRALLSLILSSLFITHLFNLCHLSIIKIKMNYTKNIISQKHKTWQLIQIKNIRPIHYLTMSHRFLCMSVYLLTKYLANRYHDCFQLQGSYLYADRFI